MEPGGGEHHSKMVLDRTGEGMALVCIAITRYASWELQNAAERPQAVCWQYQNWLITIVKHQSNGD